MIIEIFLIILSLLIPAYGIYKCSGDEEPDQRINGGNVQNDVINPLNINNEPRDNNNNNNNILNDNENNDTKFFKKQVIARIEQKKRNNEIDWRDIEGTAKEIKNGLTEDAKMMVKNPLEEIKEILNEEKLKKGEEVVKRWIDKNKGKGDVKKWIDINSGFFIKEGFVEILTLIYNSEENTYMFKNIDTNKEEEKRLLTGHEITVFLKKIRCDNKSLNIPNSSKNENIINNNEKKSFKEQVNEQIEKNIKNINWEDLPGAAQKIYDHLTKDAQRELKAFEKIENILKEKKSEGEKEAVRNWLDKNKEEIKNKNGDTIITLFFSNDANIYKNTPKEIIDIVLEEYHYYLSNGQENQLREYKVKILEEEEKKKKEKKKSWKKKEKNMMRKLKMLKIF